MAKSNLSDPIATRIPKDILASIDEVAEMTERSRSWVIVRALKTYLLNEGADILSYKEGREQIDQGQWEDLDQVIHEVEQIVAGKVA